MLDAIKNFSSLPRPWFLLFRSRKLSCVAVTSQKKSENPKANRKVMCFTQHVKVSLKSIYFGPKVQRAASSYSQPITQGCK